MRPVLVVNVDVVFALNFLLDLGWLWATGVLAGARGRAWRLVGAASAGAAGAAWAYFPGGRWLASLPGMALGTVLVLALAFWPVPLRRAPRVLTCSLLMGAAMGGSALLAALRRGPVVMGMILPATFSSALLPVGLLLCLVGGKELWRAVTRRARLARGLYGLRVRQGEQLAETTALVDTGNSLRDPLTGMPVTVVEAAVLEPLLPSGMAGAARGGWEALEGLPEAWLARCRLVPYRAVGQPGGMLLAFRPDGLWVRPPGADRWVQAPGLVGVAGEPLHPDGAYRALLPAELLQVGEGVPGMMWEGETG